MLCVEKRAIDLQSTAHEKTSSDDSQRRYGLPRGDLTAVGPEAIKEHQTVERSLDSAESIETGKIMQASFRLWSTATA